MIEGKPSATAFRVAISRAAHQLLDVPVVFNDPVAVAIIGKQAEADVLSYRRRYNSRFAAFLRAFLIARSLLAEDLLAEAFTRGVRQYVVLGAGLDTFAYRNPYAGLRVFEVDFPATQEWKRARLRDAGIIVPDSVVYASCDFSRESVMDRLVAAGLDPTAPTFVSWLGVTMYLEPPVVLSTVDMLRPIVAAPGGLVFDYFAPTRSYNPILRLALWFLANRVARAGEPFRSKFEPSELVASLRALGCSRADDYDGDALTSRYFARRADHLRTRGRGHVMHVQG